MRPKPWHSASAKVEAAQKQIPNRHKMPNKFDLSLNVVYKDEQVWQGWQKAAPAIQMGENTIEKMKEYDNIFINSSIY